MNALEYIYYAGYRLKTRGDLKNIKMLPLPVISIGNITTGGTGKTPAVIAVANEARRRGLHPCVLTRGYGGRLKGPVFVSEENYARDVGDEPLLIATRLHDVPVVKCQDRHAGGMFALENLEERPDLFIMDDGFQHRRLHRDMDVVLVSSINPFGGGKLLPSGRLREPLSELCRAGAFVITKSEPEEKGITVQVEEVVRGHNRSAPVFVSSHKPSRVYPGVSQHETAGQKDSSSRPLDWLMGRRVFAFCALAEPEAFIRSLEKAGAVVSGRAFFRDHHSYSSSDMKRISANAQASGSDWIMTTEKDIMKLRALDEPPRNCAALSIEFTVEPGFYDHIFSVARRPDA